MRQRSDGNIFEKLNSKLQGYLLASDIFDK